MQSNRNILMWGVLAVVLLAAYSNHFENGFHFDDAHAVVANPAIRSLDNIGRFFVDVKTFSHDPAARSYRPLVTASLAIDYWLGGGLRPFWFHVSTFFWFAVLLALVYALYMQVLDRACPGPSNQWIAWFSVALYGLHPVSAETVNYIIQRGDLYVVLGIVGGIVLYAWKPGWRRYGLYLLPALGGMLSKPTGIVFPLFLFAWIVLTDEYERLAMLSALIRSIPAIVLSAGFLLLEKAITPPTFFSTRISSFDYWISQPYVTLRYFRSFFLPFYLNVDTDLRPLHSLASAPALAGILFCALLLTGAVLSARVRSWQPVSLGLWWFLIGLIPTAAYPLNEVENDHRMFLPFVGLSLAVVWSIVLLARRAGEPALRRCAFVGFGVLLAFAWGTHGRNEVWRTDETLWRDDIEKSPNNARGHDQLGAALFKMSELPEAREQFEGALRIDPKFVNSYVNLGKVFAKSPATLPEAVEEFEAAVRLEPKFADAYLNLGSALDRIPGHSQNAIHEFQTALRIDPDFAEAHYSLGVVLSRMPDRFADAVRELKAALSLDPDYSDAHRVLGMLLADSPDRLPEAIQELTAALHGASDPAMAHMDLGVALSRVPGRIPDAISEYKLALSINPNFPEARAALSRAVAATPEASPDHLPDLELAVRNNPNSGEAHYLLGVALSKTSAGLPEAITQYNAALAINPDYADAHTSLGIALVLTGRAEESIQHFRTVVKLQPDSAEAHKNLGLALSRVSGDLPEAISEFEASLRIKPDNAVQQSVNNLRSQAGRSSQ